jgi:hypothetical protein
VGEERARGKKEVFVFLEITILTILIRRVK